MLRATLLPVRTLLYRRHPADFQIATITRFPTNFKYASHKEREKCPIPPPPPPPPPKDDTLLWSTVALLFLAGGFVVYAKGSPEIRDWLTLNAPWFDDIIAVLYQENMTYEEFVEAFIEDTKMYIGRLTGFNKPKQCSLDGGPLKDVPEKPKVEGEETDETAVCIPEPPPVVTQNICDIENCMVDLGESAIKSYNSAKEACAKYNALVEHTMQTFTLKGMKALRQAMNKRQEVVKKSLDKACSKINKLDEMVRYLDCGVQATKEQITNSKLMHQDFHAKIKAAFMAYQWENDKSVVMDRQWQMVEEGVDKYTGENESMFPELKYSSKKPHVSGDLDVVFYNTYRYVNQLNELYKDVSEGMTARIDRALASVVIKATGTDIMGKAENEEGGKWVLWCNFGEFYVQWAAKDSFSVKWEDELKAKNDYLLKHDLAKQLAKHEEGLSSKLAQMETEVVKKFDKMVIDQVAAEKKLLAAELEEMSTKVKILEAKLEERLKAERETRRSQELWAAGASLLAATKKGEPRVKVDKQLKAIEKASGKDDKLVLTVLKSIPSSVRKNGIVPESALRDSFQVMEKIARSVALVEQDGAPMPIYMLSWLQGLLLFMKIPGIPQEEYDKPPEELAANLDTFDLLQRARFWMERGNLAEAVRYVDALTGASRAVATTWYEAARAHLEVRQAAEAVLAHAAAMGLRYI